MISAREIAQELDLPSPTWEQTKIIEAEPYGQHLVVAGAGSGKTETISRRVLWLVANNYVSPQNILGLTFTQKAASELSERINKRINQLSEAGVISIADDQRLFMSPKISTYNAFANSILSNNSMVIAQDKISDVIDDVTAWRLARDIVLDSLDSRLVQLDKSSASVVKYVLNLSHEISENLQNPSTVAKHISEFSDYLSHLPIGKAGRNPAPYASFSEVIKNADYKLALLDLVAEYQLKKRSNSMIEFSDQIIFANQIIDTVPDIISDYQQEYKIVLLDEYQDTSTVQTRFLSKMFKGHAVMAVGDPNQSIYSWRGASADNLKKFVQQFQGKKKYPILHLNTSWRNDKKILQAANKVVSFINTNVDVPELLPRDGAEDGKVLYSNHATSEDEVAAVCDHIAYLRRQDAHQDAFSCAIVFRARKSMQLYANRLNELGVPCRVWGVGGVINKPENSDVIAALKVIAKRSSDSELLKLLVSPVFCISVSDLLEIRKCRIRFKHHNDGVTEFSLWNTLETISNDDFDISESKLSHEALLRIKKLVKIINHARELSVRDLVGAIVFLQNSFFINQELIAASDIKAEDFMLGSAVAEATKYSEAFLELAYNFTSSDSKASLNSFVDWLDIAEDNDNFSVFQDSPEPGTVHLITVHMAKGLEWEYVYIPELNEDTFPSKPKIGDGAYSVYKLPDELRGDYSSIPSMNWRICETQKEFNDSFKEYKNRIADYRLSEERRLFYVAITRAKKQVYFSNHLWSTNIKMKKISPFIIELVDAGLIPDSSVSDEFDVKPQSSSYSFFWPHDALGSRSSVVYDLANLLDEYSVKSTHDLFQDIPSSIRKDIVISKLELASKHEVMDASLSKISGSQLFDYVQNVDQYLEYHRRPYPTKPSDSVSLGVAFHTWVETFYNNGNTFISLASEDTDLFALQQNFLASEYSKMHCFQTELPVNFYLKEVLIKSKIDAIFEISSEEKKYLLVDWKTGRYPKTKVEKDKVKMQMSIYSLAFSGLYNIDPKNISLELFYVSDSKKIILDSVFSTEEISDLFSLN